MSDRLDQLVARSREVFEQSRRQFPEVVPAQSAPVLWFGNEAAYRAAPRRIITVGLNPSWAEFPPDDPWRRLRTDPAGAGARAAYDDYFDVDPYVRWFAYYEEVLLGLGHSFSSSAGSTALHTDLLTPVPTNPTWSRLPAAARRGLAELADGLWLQLVDELQPHVVLASVRYGALDALPLRDLGPWREVFVLARERPYVVELRDVQTPAGHAFVLVRGRAAQTPFGTVAKADRRRLGQALLQALETDRECAGSSGRDRQTT